LDGNSDSVVDNGECVNDDELSSGDISNDSDENDENDDSDGSSTVTSHNVDNDQNNRRQEDNDDDDDDDDDDDADDREIKREIVVDETSRVDSKLNFKHMDNCTTGRMDAKLFRRNLQKDNPSGKQSEIKSIDVSISNENNSQYNTIPNSQLNGTSNIKEKILTHKCLIFGQHKTVLDIVEEVVNLFIVNTYASSLRNSICTLFMHLLR
jgi:hypothetical protein